MTNNKNINKINQQALEEKKDSSSFCGNNTFNTPNSNGFLNPNPELHTTLDAKIRQIPQEEKPLITTTKEDIVMPTITTFENLNSSIQNKEPETNTEIEQEKAPETEMIPEVNSDLESPIKDSEMNTEVEQEKTVETEITSQVDSNLESSVTEPKTNTAVKQEKSTETEITPEVNSNLESSDKIPEMVTEETKEEEDFSFSVSDVALDTAPTMAFVSPTIEEKKEESNEEKKEEIVEEEIESKENKKEEEEKTEKIDYFHYDFSANKKESNENTATPKEEKASLGEMTFDFYNVIHANEPDVNPMKQEEKVKMTKTLQPKETEEEKKPTYTISHSSGDSYRRKKSITQYSLWVFYVFLIIFAIIFTYRLIQSDSAFTLARTDITLAIQSTYQAEIIKNKEIQENNDYEWESMDTNVAEVTSDGLITAISKGSTTIIVKSKKTKKEQKITVTAVDIDVFDLHFKTDKMTMTVGEKTSIYPIINNDETIIVNLDWLSSDSEIVEVDQNGRLSAQKEGTAVIMVQEPNSGLLSEITVEVRKKEEKKKGNSNTTSNSHATTSTVAVKSIALDTKNSTLQLGDKITIHAIVKPNNATNKTVSWTSSNSKVVTVKNGQVTAVGVGNATVTATTQDGKKTAKVTFTVKEKTVAVSGVKLNQEEIQLEVGDSQTLKASISPNNASNQNVTWTSSNENVVTVENGTITAIGIGNATITVTTQDGKKQAKATVIVKEKTIPTTGIEVSNNKVSLKIGESSAVTVTVLPQNATNKEVTWSNSKPNVATIKNGQITAISEGTTTITVTTKDGNHSASITVTVIAEPTPVEPKPEEPSV